MSVPVWVCASTAVCVCVCLLMIMMTVCRWLGTALALYADVCCRTLGALVKVLIWHIIVAEVAQQALVKYAHRTHGIRATKTLQKKRSQLRLMALNLDRRRGKQSQLWAMSGCIDMVEWLEMNS